MTKKLEKYDENRQVAEDNINQQLVAMNATKARDRAHVMLGAVAAVGQLAATLSAQTMKALQTIRNDKVYEQYGYSRFDDFLDESEYSPMSYRQFNDREKLLAAEGERLFDILNASGLTQKQRRLLGTGLVEVDDDKGTVIVRTGTEEDEPEEIEISDRNRLLQTLSALADQNHVLNTKSARQRAQIEKGQREVDSLREQLTEARQAPGTTSMFDIWLSACRNVDALATFVSEVELTEEERGQSANYISALNAAVYRVEMAFIQKAPADAAEGKKKGKTKGAAAVTAETTLDDEELADLME